MILGAITHIEDLRTWFYKFPKHVHYRLYNGRTTNGTTITSSPSDIPDWNKDQCWEDLEKAITMFAKSGGVFTIKVYTANRNNTKDTYTITLSLDMRNQSTAGIRGVNNYGVAGSGQSVDDYIAEKINSKMEIFQLQNQVESLEAELEQGNTGSIFERLASRLLENDKLDQIIDVLAFRFMKGGTNISMNGFDELESEEAIKETPQFDVNKMQNALARINNHFPDLVGFLEKIANYIEQNPEMAKAMFDKANE